MSSSVTRPDGGYQVTVPRVYVNEVRNLLGDDPESNDVVTGTEFSDSMIANHLVAIVQDYNNTPPILSPRLTFALLALDSYQHQQLRAYIFEAAAGRALQWLAVRKARNFMNLQSGSVSYNENANFQAMASMGAGLLQTWEQRKREFKIALNMQGGWAVAHTDLVNPLMLDSNGVLVIAGGPL